MKKVLNGLIWITAKIAGRKNLERLLIYTAKSINVNLHVHGLVQIGCLNGYCHLIKDERFFMSEILPCFFSPSNKLLFFDVGGNIGDYSIELKKYFPEAEIHSFEPVKKTFEILCENIDGRGISAHNLGLGESTGTGVIFNTVNNANTELSSLYKDVFYEIFKTDDEIAAIEFKMDTIDNFCKTNNISNIDFLKIDVEGHELSVLKGAKNMLSNKRINVIQFELNSHNVYSRVFLKDFYLILEDFEFYRSLHDGVIKLGLYNYQNEIFTLQNIIAVRKEICHLLNAKHLNSLS